MYWSAESKVELLHYRGRRRPERCSICLGPMTGGTKTLGCGHQFHRACIKDWISRNNITCPLCRKEIDASTRNMLLGIGSEDLEISYGRNVNVPLPPPWEQNQEDAGRATGNLFLVTDTRAQRALSYLVLSHYLESDNEETDIVHSSSTPETVSYDYIMWAAQRAFSTEDWSQALVGYQGNLRPPFTIVEQIWDDGIEYERLRIGENTLVQWWANHGQQVIQNFSPSTSS